MTLKKPHISTAKSAVRTGALTRLGVRHVLDGHAHGAVRPDAVLPMLGDLRRGDAVPL